MRLFSSVVKNLSTCLSKSKTAHADWSKLGWCREASLKQQQGKTRLRRYLCLDSLDVPRPTVVRCRYSQAAGSLRPCSFRPTSVTSNSPEQQLILWLRYLSGPESQSNAVRRILGEVSWQNQASARMDAMEFLGTRLWSHVIKYTSFAEKN